MLIIALKAPANLKYDLLLMQHCNKRGLYLVLSYFYVIVDTLQLQITRVEMSCLVRPC